MMTYNIVSDCIFPVDLFRLGWVCLYSVIFNEFERGVRDEIKYNRLNINMINV